MKPLIKWSGGKQDEIDEIIKYIPENYDTYIEPFFGGGSVFFHLKPQKAAINDIHKELVVFYTVIKQGHQHALYEMMKSKEFTQEEYYKIRDEFQPSNEIEKAFQFYYLRKTCYRGMLRYNSKGKFNIPYGRYKTINYEELKNEEYGKLMKNTEVFNEDFSKLFEMYGDNPDNFCFIDQPYDSKFTDYGYCKFAKKEQKQLAKMFKKARMKCLMIVGETEMIRNLYDGYIVASYPKKYRFKLHSGRVNNSINTNHLVIANFPCL